MNDSPSLATRREDICDPNPWTAAWALGHRELVRFFRQRNRVIGAIGQPILFWLLFGVGLGQSFRLPIESESAGLSFQQYYVPGTLVLIVLFTAIFTTISVIEDRREGFLQSVLVSRKIIGGSLIALLQALVFLILAFFSIGFVSVGVFLHATLLLFCSAVGLTGLGFVLAWRMDSTQGFHAVMSVLLMPMWLLSGAFFPVPILKEDASVLQIGLFWVMQLNPVTYQVAGLRRAMFATTAAELNLPSLLVCWLATIGFAISMYYASSRITRSRTQGDLQ